jgi:hypothetical protein
MIQSIRVDHVLRETVATPYNNLVTRTTGSLVRRRIEAMLADSGAFVALLDFSDIALLDCSCADEIVAKLAFGADSGAVRCWVALRGLREDQRDAIEHVLGRHGVVVWLCDETGPEQGVEIVGELPADARAALRAYLTAA